MDLVGLDDIQAAAENIRGVAVRTPLLPWLDGDRTLGRRSPGVLLKPENLQPTGAFKVRGARHAVACLPEARRAAGVVTHSSGNHGQALAYAARAFGVPCVVVMPDVAPPVKVAATRALGAEVVLVPPAERLARMQQLVASRGLSPIPPYDHRDVIAGQGTVGLEIVQDLSDVDVVLVPVGGGGLAAGVATAVKALRPSAAVVGVEPELAADARDSLAAGTVVTWPVERAYQTIADALRTPLSELTLAHLSARLDDILTVSDDEIRDAVGRLARSARLVAEPGGAAAVAAYLHHRASLPAGRTVAVVSGGNIDPQLLRSLL
ncbi:MAG: threonine/serine dehydratase [Micromonosporaceae bacterium]|nr:threonine/serine dehydratase [Micromonosporaceae bacterium]